MIRHGKEPFLECSSRGDTRFSALFARIRGRGNRTIEEIYQGSKLIAGVYGHSVKSARGHKADNQADLAILYELLWMEYLNENPNLWPVLRAAKGLSDMFGKEGHNCQATALWAQRKVRLHLEIADLL